MVIIQTIENIVRHTDWTSGEVQETCIKSWLVEHDGKRHQRNFDKEIKWDIQDSNKVTRMQLRKLQMLAGVKPSSEPEEEDEPEKHMLN